MLITGSEDRGRRQWGADRRPSPLPAVPHAPSDRTIAAGRMAVVITFTAWLAFCALTLGHQLFRHRPAPPPLPETLAYLALVTALSCSALAYLIARLGFFTRTRDHRRVARATIDEQFAAGAPSVTVLVPSYQEEASVVRMTLLTAALQEYPDLHIVLLIDDPPHPRYAKPEELLRASRALPSEIEALLAEPAAYFAGARDRFAAADIADRDLTVGEIVQLAEHHAEAVVWLRQLIADQDASDHNERFVADHVLGRLAADLSLTSAALRGAASDPGARLPARRGAELYQRLACTFQARLSSFERKRYASLSHEPNKAMNLNSYMGLMGHRYREVPTPGGLTLVDAGEGPADLEVPESDYVLTLDADSVVLPEYCVRLVYLLEQPHNARLAVAQTPYSAFPGAETRLERIAGATTDLQHIVHQGMTHYDATFWVGANAVLRKRALDEIGETEHVGGWPVRRYIKDRTVIEDTESSIDLVTHGWQLVNYPERLSYSATPPDFGSLCIQRQRWANGGLLIAPKLWPYMRAKHARGQRNRLSELFLRVNYMASICWSSIALPLLLVIQFDNQLVSPLVFVVAVPYFLAMGADLRACGYKALDVARIYGFNLLLLPVNLAGVAASLVQGLTGAKGQFRRTPKVRNRTVPALSYVVLPYALVALSLYTLRNDIAHHHWGNAGYAAVNALLAAYAIVAFVGLRHSFGDVWANVKALLHRPAVAQRRPARLVPAPLTVEPAVEDWQRVLYFGAADQPVAPAAPVATAPAPAPVGVQGWRTVDEGQPAHLPGELSVEASLAPS